MPRKRGKCNDLTDVTVPNSNKRYSQADLANFRQRSDHAILRKKIQVVHFRLHEPQHVKCIRTLTFALKDWTTMFVKFARRKLLLYKRNMEVWLSLKASFIWTNCKTSRGMFFGENNAKESRLVKSSQTLHTNYQAQWGDLGLDCCHGTAAFCGT